MGALRTCSLVAMLVALLASAGAAFAASPTETIQTAVERVLANDGAAQVKLVSTAERRAQIRQGAESLFDFKEMARRSLGDRWEVLSRADQDEFVRLFTNLIAASYMSKIELYAGEPIVFLGEQVNGDGAAVQSRMVTPNGSQVDVEYHLYRAQDRWAVYDVSVSGVSLVGNYRTQFSHLLQRTSFADLLKTMRQKAGS
jgi:phospholipid transport system substrate-binding protein